MHCLRDTILLTMLLALLVAAWLTSDCHAECMACWWLKGVIVQLKNGTTIEGYVTWNDDWPSLEYNHSCAGDENCTKRALENKKEFPAVIFDPKAQIDGIKLYTHLRSIKYPVANALVTLRDPVKVNVEEIRDLKLNPGPHDGYGGAVRLPLVSERTADLLQTKPLASCRGDQGAVDVYWVSYDKSFPAEELQRLCEYSDDGVAEAEKKYRLKERDIFGLYYDTD